MATGANQAKQGMTRVAIEEEGGWAIIYNLLIMKDTTFSIGPKITSHGNRTGRIGLFDLLLIALRDG